MRSKDLTCPYTNCGESFPQPVMVTDCSKLPRETHYACPHCMLRLDLLLEDDTVDNFGHVLVKAVDDEAVLSHLETRSRMPKLGGAVSNPQATRPSKGCRHFLGYLRSLPHGMDIPDDCAVCADILKCYVRKK